MISPKLKRAVSFVLHTVVHPSAAGEHGLHLGLRLRAGSFRKLILDRLFGQVAFHRPMPNQTITAFDLYRLSRCDPDRQKYFREKLALGAKQEARITIRHTILKTERPLL